MLDWMMTNADTVMRLIPTAVAVVTAVARRRGKNECPRCHEAARDNRCRLLSAHRDPLPPR